MQYENDVLIVGAGPAGLALAVDLARWGVRFRIIDAAERPFVGSRGKGLQPRTLEIFDDLGVIGAILDAGALYPRLRVHAGPFSFRAGSLGTAKPASERTPYPNLWMVPQARTEAILRERLKGLGHSVEFDRSLRSLEQSGDAVVAELSSGESVRTKFLVGADGGHSTVRKQLGLKLVGDALGEQSMLVADVEVVGLGRREWHVWPFAKGGVVGLCPLPHTDLFQFTAPAALSEKDIADIIRRTSGRKVARIAWQSTYRPSVRMAEHYRAGRVLLVGDAAHVHPPAGGQGLNTSVQDSYNLGWKLAQVMRGGDEGLLDSYEAERLPVAASVLGLTKDLHLSGSVKRGERTNQLLLNYRTSPLSSGESYRGLYPGDRMPDARLPDGSRLFDSLRGPHATEILVTNGKRILVRPDGYIGYIGNGRPALYADLPIQECRVPKDFLS